MVKFFILFFVIFSVFHSVDSYANWLIRVGIETNKTIRNSIESSQISFKIEHDHVLMAEIGNGLFIGSAQVEYRRYPPPEEQICKTKILNAPSYAGRKFEKFLTTFVNPEFGFLTLANNIAISAIKFADPPSTLYVKILQNTKLYAGQTLRYYGIEKGTASRQNVQVVDFKYCLEAFDPNHLFLLDENEQFCTTSPDVWKDQSVEHFINGLLFAFNDKIEYNELNEFDKNEPNELVGIESMSNGQYSLSTFVPYHCDGFLKLFGEKPCE